jgi:hypothetical protein
VAKTELDLVFRRRRATKEKTELSESAAAKEREEKEYNKSFTPHTLLSYDNQKNTCWRQPVLISTCKRPKETKEHFPRGGFLSLGARARADYFICACIRRPHLFPYAA